jgi:hypothetical protein
VGGWARATADLGANATPKLDQSHKDGDGEGSQRLEPAKSLCHVGRLGARGQGGTSTRNDRKVHQHSAQQHPPVLPQEDLDHGRDSEGVLGRPAHDAVPAHA